MITDVVTEPPVRPAGHSPSRSTRRRMSDRGLGTLLVVPAITVLLLTLVLPTVFAFVYSFLDLNYVRAEGFGGLANWESAVFHERTPALLARTAVFVLGAVVLSLAVAFPIAVGLDRLTRRLSTVLQLVVLVPWVLSTIVAALLFRWTTFESLGVVPYLVEVLGGHFDPLIHPVGAMLSMILVASWRTVGFAVLLLLAGLKSVDHQVYEASKIDGANAWQRFWYVTLPMIRTPATVVTIILLMSNLNNVEVPLVVTAGGPGDTTTILPLQIYKLAFTSFDVGGAVALASAAMVLNVVLVMVYMRLTRWRA